MDLTRSNIIFEGCRRLALALAALTTVSVQAQSGALMTIQAGQPGAVVSSNLVIHPVEGGSPLTSNLVCGSFVACAFWRS